MIEEGKIRMILKFPPFRILNDEVKERDIQNTVQHKQKKYLCSCYSKNFPALEFPPSNMKKSEILKLIFPVLYPIIYNLGLQNFYFLQKQYFSALELCKY